MCCTIGQVEAKLTATKLYAGEAIYNDKYVHVLAYQNNAESDWRTPNAMIIPFPTSKPMGQDNILDTSRYSGFLDDISEATAIRSRGFSRRDEDSFMLGAMAAGVAEVFDVGVYTVILATHVAQVPEALTRVSEDKRPAITTQFLLHYGRLYPKQPVALCCWTGRVEASPLLWWYEPTNPDTLFIPTMDAHDGGPPNLEAMVETDHVISVGSKLFPTGSKVYYNHDYESLANASALLPTKVHGTRPEYRVKNGDTFVDVNALRVQQRDVLMKRGANQNSIHTLDKMNGWHA